MISLYTETEFNNAKSRDKLPLVCLNCNNTFFKSKKDIIDAINNTTSSRCIYCSDKCQKEHLYPPVYVNCEQCNKTFKKKRSQIKKTKLNFCSHKCSATYYNLHKTTGTRRSKLEKWLEQQLNFLYPNTVIKYNSKEEINSEFDIYIPSLKLAFELNGIYHYEPIHGIDKLSKVQSNDNRKFQACIEHGIELCIIDVSGMKYFKESNAKKYLDIIVNILNIKWRDGRDLNSQPLE